MTHELKITPQYYKPVLDGEKTFEVRKNDRNFSVGDKIILREYENGEYTQSKDIHANITYILDDSSGYVIDGYVIMGIQVD